MFLYYESLMPCISGYLTDEPDVIDALNEDFSAKISPS